MNKKELSEYMRKLGKKGAKVRAKKVSREQLSAWGRRGAEAAGLGRGSRGGKVKGDGKSKAN